MYFIFIIAIFFLFFFYYLIMKKRKLNQLTALLNDRNKQEVRSFCEKKINCMFLSTYILDLYMAKSLLIQPSIEELKGHLRTMFLKTYAKHEEREYLTLYFHYFIIKQDECFALELLDKIQETEDISLKKYCGWTKEVLLDHNASLIAEMDEAIQRKEFSGFALGVVCHLIASQYEALQETKSAIEWYETVLTVLQPTDLYVSQVKENLTALDVS